MPYGHGSLFAFMLDIYNTLLYCARSFTFHNQAQIWFLFCFFLFSDDHGNYLPDRITLPQIFHLAWFYCLIGCLIETADCDDALNVAAVLF